MLLFAIACTAAANASTLHGRVKDEQCAVLGKIAVRVRGLDGVKKQVERTVITDDGGNYSVDLAAGAYEVCIARGAAGQSCTRIDIPERGDKWITTQLQDTAPDLSTLGNHAY